MTNPPPPGDPNQWGAAQPGDPNQWGPAQPGDPNQWGAPPSGDPNQWASAQPGPGQWGPPPLPPTPPKKQPVLLFVVIGVVALLVIVGGVVLGVSMLSSCGGDSCGDDKGGTTVAEPKAEVDGGGIVVGESGPKVDIYLDFICPACGNFHATNDDVLKTAIDDKSATIVFHPLNFLAGASDDRYSLRAAAASVCAADDDKFYDYYRVLMQNQPAEGGSGLADAELVEFGGDVGLGGEFGDCVTDGRYLPWIERETDKALKSGVDSTPTVRIDGKQIESTDFATEFAEATK